MAAASVADGSGLLSRPYATDARAALSDLQGTPPPGHGDAIFAGDERVWGSPRPCIHAGGDASLHRQGERRPRSRAEPADGPLRPFAVPVYIMGEATEPSGGREGGRHSQITRINHR